MTISTELLMAVLSMDAYNREYNSGIDGLNASKVGQASIIDRTAVGIGAPEYQAWQSASFYAVAYQMTDNSIDGLVEGEIIISYRGTDERFFELPLVDLPIITGDYDEQQVQLAMQFHSAIAATAENPIFLTGHSLGGGLAGMTAAAFDEQSLLVDPIGFVGAYDNFRTDFAAHFSVYASYLAIPEIERTQAQIDAIEVFEDLFKQYGLDPQALPTFSDPDNNYQAFHLDGSIAENVRLGTESTQLFIPSLGSFADFVGGIGAHSASLHAIMMYEHDERVGGRLQGSWVHIAEPLLHAMFSEDIGAATGFDPAGTNGVYSAASKMLAAIAYSALDSGSAGADAGYGYVFGNTGIRAMFDDADELGSIVTAGKVSEALDDAIPGLTQAIVQFAGLMANRHVNYHDYQQPGSLFNPLEGILMLSDGNGSAADSGADAALLTLSVNQDLWRLGLTDGNAPDVEILGLGTLVEDLFHQAGGGIGEDTIRKAMEDLYKDGDGAFSVTKAIGSVQFSLSGGPLQLTLADPETDFDATHASLFAATDGNDTIDGDSQNNIVAGADGDDILTGHLGRDLLLGGDGSDLFIDSVTERSDTDGRQNEDDVYIGSSQYSDLVTNFHQWLLNGTETDIVRYTIDKLAEDDPATPENEAALQQEGLRLTDLKTTSLGDAQAIMLSVTDLASGASGTDHLVGIEKVELSDRPDEILVTDDALDAAIRIDMGKSGRVVSELPEGETLAPGAFTTKVDVADYSGLSHGINYLNGVTSDRQQVGSLEGVFQWAGWGDELLTVADYAAKGMLGHNDALQIVGADRIKLTSHDDVLINAEFGSIVETGAGHDKIWLSDGVAITDLSNDDRITLAGVITLYGGMRNSVSEDARAWGAYGTAYGLNDAGELIISNAFWRVTYIDENGVPQSKAAEMYVLNWAATYGAGTSWATGAGNISLIEYTITSSRLLDLTGDEKGTVSFVGAGLFELLGYYMKTITGEASFGNTDPLVLDLDGDGIELTSLDHSKARFDTDNDMYAEATGFTGKDDGILVRDINADGKVNSAAEMFGGGGVTGFGALSALDGNTDGVIDVNDNGLADFDGDGDVDANDRFDALMVWQDRNENHATDLGELKSVSEWGIASISLPGQDQGTSSQVVAGNTIDRVSSYTLADGTVRTVADVSFKVENQNTTYVGQPITISNSVLDLANLKGYGTLVSLHQAMSLRPASEATVRTVLDSLSSNDLSILREEIKPILRAWAEGSPVKVNGQVMTGVVSQNTYQDLVVVKDTAGDVVDYLWGFSPAGQSFGTFANETNPGARFAFASGVIISLGGSFGQGIDERTDVSGLIGSLAEDAAVTVTTGTTLDADGKSVGYLQYASQDGYVRIYYQGSSSWSSSLNSASDHSLPGGFSFSEIAAEDFAFYERLIGESLQPFFVKPDSASGGYGAVTEFLSKMEGTLNLFAVRLAVQSGPLSHHFDSIVYDATKDQFRSADGRQLSDVFDSVLNEAESGANALAQLQGWKPFFDVFLADYSRGNLAKQVTYSFLVQNMLHAVEQAPGGITIEQFAQAFGVPQDVIISGSGELVGTSDIDLIIVDGSETTVSGGSGADSYVIGRHFGPVTIYDNDGAMGSDVDTVRFSAHNAADIEATRDGIDLILTDRVTGATIRITNQFEGRWPGATIGDASFDYGVSQIVFADGSLWNKVDIAEQVSKIDDAPTTIEGTADIDVLQGGKGDDILKGAGDTDIYRYSLGDGNDTIIDLEDNSFRNDMDMLQFLGGIRIGDLTFSREADSSDITIGFKDGIDGSITIQGQYDATYTGVYGTWRQYQISLFTFDDGSSLTSDQVADLILDQYSTDGDDVLYGMNREDILRAGKGDDYISGGNESDTYVFSRGDGHDVIEDNMTNILSGTSDTLLFSTDIRAEDIVLGRDPANDNSIVLSIAGTADSVTLKNQYDYAATSVFGNVFFDRIETIEFADGSQTTWSWLDMATWVLQQAVTDGDDIIHGFAINDVLSGGAGNDFLSGGNGDDTYLFGHGYGNETIYERNLGALSGGDADKVVFQGETTADDVAITRNGRVYDLVITLKSTGETLTLQDQTDYNAINYHPDQVDEFHFSDGTVWSAADLRSQYLLQARTDGDDVITGFFSNDTLDGGAGDDVLYGGDGSDTYVFGLGYGHDIIEEIWRILTRPEDDKVVFGEGVTLAETAFTRAGEDGEDLLITLTQSGETLLIRNEFHYWPFDQTDVEEFVFADGSIVTKEQIKLKLLTSTVADETINGFGGNDTFTYSRGGGNDVINDAMQGGSNDQLVLTDIVPEHVTLLRNGNDVTLIIAESAAGVGDGGSVRLNGTLLNYFGTGVDKVVFADGTVWTYADMRQMVLTNTAADETINGTGVSDLFYYARGNGNDTINDGMQGGNSDALLFADINPLDVTMVRNGDDVTLVIGESAPGAGDGGSVRLNGTLRNYYSTGVDQVIFADGTVWTPSQMRDMLLTSTSADETLNGFATNDTFRYGRGGGNDTINDGMLGGNNDRLILADVNLGDVTLVKIGTDLKITVTESEPGAGDAGSVLIKETLDDRNDQGIENILLADGTTWTRAQVRVLLLQQAETEGNDMINGFNVADTIAGGLGDDLLKGWGGNDTYVYARGDGNDTIIEDSGNGATDQLVFSDIDTADVQVAKVGSELVLVISETSQGAMDGGTILLSGTYSGTYQKGIEKVVFADGTQWSRSDLLAKVITLPTVPNATVSGDGNNETLTGTWDADVLRGNAGNDILLGDAGGDTYVYAKGDGNDVIADGAGFTDNVDRLQFVDLFSSQVKLTRSGDDLTVTILPTNETITIQQQYASDTDFWGVERIEFADGYAWDKAVLDRIGSPFGDSFAAIVGTQGADTLDGTGGEDVLRGSLGDDLLRGSAGSDTYIFEAGDGNDYIDDEAGFTDNTDVLKLVDIASSEVQLVRNGVNVDIHVLPTGEAIALDEQLYSDVDYWGLEQIQFSDGVTWNRDQIKAKSWIVGSQGDDNLVGTDTVDVLSGGSGDDTLTGGLGNDTFVFKAGFGHDTIADFTPGAGTDDVLQVDNTLFADFEAVLAAAAQVGSDTVIAFDAANTITLKNVGLANLHADDVRFVA